MSLTISDSTKMPYVISPLQLYILACCSGLAVANLYYSQPLLAQIAATFTTDINVGLVTTATQIGYACSILLILPLGDLADRRKLMIGLSFILSAATFASSQMDSMLMLIVSSFFIGVGASSTQIMVPLAADLSQAEDRGKAIGVVFSGILSGILLARTLSGFIGELYGWRAMFIAASVIAAILALTLYLTLPALQAKSRQSYHQLLLSMGALIKQHRELRVACLIQTSLFAIFSAFWSVLSLVLFEPPFGFGAAVAGSFGFIGLVGVIAANFSGRLSDKIGVKAVLLLGLISCVAAYAIFAINLSLISLVLGIVVLDFGLSIANVANQSKILGLDESARSRINTIYVTSIFIGGAIGSAAASFAWVNGGWPAVSLFGLVVALFALTVHLLDRKCT